MQSRSPHQKLKDSCDVCSASKVRCDKQKPGCARCASLNYQCMYSPARRVGRPHRLRQKKSEPMCVDSTSTRLTEAPQMDEPAMSIETCSDAQPSDDHMLSTVTSDMTPQSARQQQQQQQSSQQSQGSSPGSRLNTDEAACCTKTAMALLEMLDAVTRKPFPTQATVNVTDTCRLLTTMFNCPCSNQPGVALLVASVCIALMDMIRNVPAHVGQDTTFIGAANATVVAGDSDDFMSMWSLPSLDRLSSSSSSSSCATIDSQATEQNVAQVKKVVSRFADRYRQGTGSGVEPSNRGWIFGLLAALLRSRLHSLTREINTRRWGVLGC